MGVTSCWTGTMEAVTLVTTLRSNGQSVPLAHWPPTSGVLETLGTGFCGRPACQFTLPQMVSRLVALMASRMDCLSSTFLVRLRASATTSNTAECSRGCVHCLVVLAVNASSNCWQVWPLRDDLNGWV